jgi:hypothetical protein
MMKGLKFVVIGLLTVLSILGLGQDADAYLFNSYGSSYGGYYGGYGSYRPGPYTYTSVWHGRGFLGLSGHYHHYNPGLYYTALDYSTRNSLVDFSTSTRQDTYGFVSQNIGFN